MGIFRFENAEYLYGLAVIPLLTVLYIIYSIVKKSNLKKVGDKKLVNQLKPDSSSYKPVLKFIIAMIALAAIIVGIANPQIGSKLQEYKREGVDIMIALDVSNSMNCEDVKPNRLERAKKAITNLIDNLKSDRIGLVVFAGTAYLQLPLTIDYSAAKLILSTIDTDLILDQGTAIGNAIDLAMDAFDKSEDKDRVLIIITDGENHEDDALGMAAKTAEKKIIIHTIGMGTIDGGPIPVYSHGIRTGFRKDKEGQVVITKLDASMLQQLAAAGNGKFIRAASADPNLTKLVKEIEGMDKKEFSSRMFADYESRFQYLFGAALLMLLAEFFLSDKKNKLISMLTSFVEKSGR